MRTYKLALLAAVTLACFAWSVWGLDRTAVSAALWSFDAVWLAPVLVGFAGQVGARAVRFWFVLESDTRLGELVGVMQVGFLAINVVPLRMGELVRPYLLTEVYGVPFGAGVAAVVVERVLDMFALLTLLIAAAWVADLHHGVVVGGVDLLRAGQRAMIVGGGGGVLLIAFLAIGGPRVIDRIEAIAVRVAPPVAPLVIGVATSVVGAIRGLAARPKAAVGAVIATVGLWGSTLVMVGAVMRGFSGIVPSLGMLLTNWAATMTAMALIPTPGFVGSFEAGSVASLTLFGVDADVARAFAVLLHALMFATTAATGIAFLVAQGWSLASVVQNSREMR